MTYLTSLTGQVLASGMLGALAGTGVALAGAQLFVAAAVALLIGSVVLVEVRDWPRLRAGQPLTTLPWLRRPRVQRRVVATAAAVVVLGAWVTALLGTDGRLDAIATGLVSSVGVALPWLFIATVAAAMVVAPLPNGPFPVLAGLIWGIQLGTVYMLIGQAIGSTVAFVISRRFGRRFLPRLIGHGAAHRVDEMSNRTGPMMVFWARLIPFIPSDLAAYAAGMTAMRFRVFFPAFMAASLLPTVLAVWVGASITGSWQARIVSVLVLAAITLGLSAWWLHRNRAILRPPAISDLRGLRRLFAAKHRPATRHDRKHVEDPDEAAR